MAVGHQLSSVARYRIQLVMIAMLAVLCTLLAPGHESYAQAAAPAAPTGLAAASDSHDSVKLSWNDPQNDSITGYQVLRRSRDGDEYEDEQGAAEFVAVADDTGSSATETLDAQPDWPRTGTRLSPQRRAHPRRRPGLGRCRNEQPGLGHDHPRIDGIAASGANFTAAHSPSSACTGTPGGLLIGRYAWRSWLTT